jgi:FtsH-binding integral membrane protein
MKRKNFLPVLISVGLMTAMIVGAEQRTLTSTLETIAKNLQDLAIAAAIIGVVFGGFYFITAGGDTDRIKTGRAIILWSLVGAVIVLIASAVADLAIKAVR